MELKYVAELEKHNVSLSDLPEDAKTGVEQIGQVIRAVKMLEKKGKSPTVKTLNKIKAMDKWVSFEIIDYVNETDKNEDDIPFESEDIIEEIETKKESMNEEETQESEVSNNDEVVIDPRGERVESELAELYKSGFKKFDIEDLQSKSTFLYELLFDTYEPDEDNGLETSRYKLLERTDGFFYLTKK